MSSSIKNKMSNSLYNEDLYEIIADNIKECMAIKNNELKYILVNEAFCRLFGVNKNDVIGKSDHDIFPKEIANISETEDKEIIKLDQKQNFGWEYIIDEKKLFLNVTKCPLKTSNSNMVGILCIFSDDTANMLNIEDILNRHKLIINNIKEGISVYEEISENKRKLIDCNSRYVEMSGYTYEELMSIDDTVDIQIDYEGKEKWIENKKNFHEGKIYSGIFSWKRPDKRENYIEYTAIPMKINNRNIIFGIDHDVTKQVTAENKSKLSISLFTSALESVADGVLATNLSNNIILYNNQFVKMWGISIDNPDEKTILDIIVKQLKNPEIIFNMINSVNSNPNIDTFDILELKDGKIFECLTIPQNMEGNIVGRVWSFRDITQMKQAEKALRRSEEMFRAFVEHSWDGFELIDAEGNILYASPAIAKISGYSVEEIIGRNIFIAIAPEYRDYGKKLIDEILEKPGQTVNMKLKYLRKDGEWRWLEGYCTNFLNNPNINAIIINYHDITERKQAIDALRESEEKYKILIENANEGIVVYQDGIIKFANPKIIEIIGYSRYEIEGKSIINYIHPEDRNKVVEMIFKNISGENVTSVMLLRLIAKNGSILWIEGSGIPIKWEDKPAFLSFINDVTKRRKMEEELLRMQKLESIGTLAGGIAHDFNNTLTGILGNISLAKMFVEQKDKVSERLSEAERAAYKAKDLTSQLLTFSKGGSPILKTVSMIDILTEATSFALSGSKSTYHFNFANDLWAVIADQVQMNQAVNNIIINADQAMPQGGVIKINAENFMIEQSVTIPLAPGPYVKISFIDHGIGIPDEHLTRIFDPYFTTKQKGSGLGLAITYSIIKRHNGHIMVDSVLGVGTTFTVYIPASLEKVASKTISTREKSVMEKGKILIMDDADVIRDLLSQILKRAGYIVVATSDGDEAIEAYINAKKSGQPFDAVIMDLTIPGGMGGVDAIAKLREIDPNVKAIVSSGYSNDPVMSNFRDYGFNAIIAKPYRTNEVYEILREVLIA